MGKSKNRFAKSITRRDFLNGSVVGAGGLLLGGSLPGLGNATTVRVNTALADDWYGYGGVGDFRLSHGNTPELVNAAHRLRDGDFVDITQRVKTTEQYDLVIVGSGMAGLSAALEFSKHRKPGQTCLVLDNHPIFGGEAKENEFNVAGTRLIAPQGANGFFVPDAVDNWQNVSGDPRYYAELNIPREFRLAEWPAARKPLGFCADNYG